MSSVSCAYDIMDEYSMFTSILRKRLLLLLNCALSSILPYFHFIVFLIKAMLKTQTKKPVYATANMR